MTWIGGWGSEPPMLEGMRGQLTPLSSGRGDGGAGGALAPPLFAKMKFAHLYFTVFR